MKKQTMVGVALAAAAAPGLAFAAGVTGTAAAAAGVGVLANPTLAYVLFVAGLFAVTYEVIHPGFGVAGVVGGICLALAIWGFRDLPVNGLGVALLVVGAGLVVAEAFLPTHGLLAVGGVGLLLWGSLALYQGDSAARVSWWAIAPTLAITTGLFLWAVTISLRALRKPAMQGEAAMLGAQGTAITALNPEGQVRVLGEEWSALSVDGPIDKGAAVAVAGRDGLKLKVKKG